MSTIYLDGQYLKASTQLINAFAPGVFKARGVFETMLGVDGVALDLDLHLKRLRQGLKVLGIAAPSVGAPLFNQLLVANKLSCARVRLMVWQDGKERHVMAVALPYQTPLKKIYRVCVIKTNRAANDKAAHVKSLDYALFANAYAQAQARGFDEALLLNSKGHIFEASRANIFMVRNKILYTPPLASGCLNGITRQQVMRQARSFKISVLERNLTPPMIQEADAAFLTNALIGIQPIQLVLRN